MQNLKTILYVSATVENFKFPVGTRENPAMTCKELMDIDNVEDGEDDLFELYCMGTLF